ncbi:MAG: TetR/AcrR family transcriptional regulator [Saprospiraceae bacterium]|nr:TetR/AcrR family transcriptional regulator [Saprospiraceae bacterium]
MFTEQQEKWLKRVEELFFKLGIKSLTMDDVARELGISKKTLYSFVENKDDLVAKVMERHMAEQCKVDEVMHAEASDAVDEMVRIIQQIVSELGKMKPNVVHEMQKYHREVWNRINDFQHSYILNLARQNLEWGRRDGLYRTDFDLETAARFYIAGAMIIFDEQYFPKPPYTYDFLFKEFITNYLHSIVSEKGLKMLKAKLGPAENLPPII